MAESYDYLYEEIDISGDLIPCEFCGDLFPIGVLIEHSSGCQPDLFYGNAESDLTPKVDLEPVADTVPVGKSQITPESSTNPQKWHQMVFPNLKSSSSIKIEQLVKNEIYDITSKDGGGSVMTKLSSIGSEQKMSHVESEKTTNSGTSNSYIHFKSDIPEQGESDSDDDYEPSKVRLEQANAYASEMEDSMKGLGDEDLVELSDDNNEENETIESFLLRSSLELRKIKQYQERSKLWSKLKESKYASYDREEAYRRHEARNIYYQDCC